MNKKYPYIFLFGGNKLDLHGRIDDYWNDIYDMFFEYGKMTVERSDCAQFTKRQIIHLFLKLEEDMSEDCAIIKLSIQTPTKLEFIHDGEIYGHIPMLKDEPEDKAVKRINKNLEKLNSENLSIAIAEFDRAVAKSLYSAFNVSEIEKLDDPQYANLRYVMTQFSALKKDKTKRLYYVYNIIEKLEADSRRSKILMKSGISKNSLGNITKICNTAKIGSRHTGKYSKLERLTKTEINYCENVCKSLISAWLKVEDIK